MATPFDQGWPNWFGSEQHHLDELEVIVPVTGEHVSRIGSTPSNLGNPDRVVASDDSKASNGAFPFATSSDYLVARDYPWDLPTGGEIDSIDGFEVLVEGFYTGTGGFMRTAGTSIWESGAESGTPKTPLQNFGSSDAVQTFGSASDLWGLTPTVADLNDSGFGSQAFFDNSNGGNNYNFGIDWVHVRPYLTGSAGVQWHGGIYA